MDGEGLTAIGAQAGYLLDGSEGGGSSQGSVSGCARSLKMLVGAAW